MVKYRNKLEIIVDVLNAACKGSKKTKIMYAANLSYKLLDKYLTESVELDFLCTTNNGYEVTEKGKAFLEKYHDFSSKYSQIESELQCISFEREALERLCELPKNGRYGQINHA